MTRQNHTQTARTDTSWKPNGALAAFALALVFGFLAMKEVGATDYWQGSSPSPDGIWTASDGTVWQDGTVPGNETVYISNGGTANIASNVGSIDQLHVTSNSTLAITAAGSLQSTWTYFQSGAHLDLNGYLSPLGMRVSTPLTVSSATAQLADRDSLTVGDGTAGSVVQSNGSVSQAGRNFRIGTDATGSYTLSGGTLTQGFDAGYYTWIGGDSYGSFNQTGGSASLSGIHVGSTAAGGQYDISGGSLTGQVLVIGGYPGNVVPGTFRVIGSDATSIQTDGYWYQAPGTYPASDTYHQTANGTLEYLFDAGGVTPIDLATGRTVTLGGTLRLGLEGGTALFTSSTPQTLMTYGSGQAGATDFATFDTGVFSVTKNAASYTAQLEPTKEAFATPLALGSSELFTQIASGWFEMGTTGTVPLELAVNTDGAATLADVLTLLADSGFAATDLGAVPFNLGIDVPVAAAGSLFAWDFSSLDGVTVDAVQYIPEPGTLLVLASGLALGLLRRRR